jgi:uncharacterized protein (PEP-CTERM system associated)
LAAGVLSGIPAQAQLAPQLGPPVQLGDLRQAFERAYGPVAAPIDARAWTVTPAIEVEVLATDDQRALLLGTTTGKRGGDVVTSVTPSIFVQANSQRLTGSFGYAPSARFFASDSRQNTVSHNLNAAGRATIFEDLLFLNASANMSEFSRFGGLGAGTGGNIGRQDRVQSTSASIGPELRISVGDYGAFDLRHTVSYLKRSGQTAQTNTPFAPALAIGSTITNTTHASFTSGQQFQRLNFTLGTTRIMYDGPGVLKGAHRYSETLDLGYAATRTVTLLGMVGHQDIRYGGLRPIRLNDFIWNVGLRWNPSPDTTMTVRYGYRDGGDNFSFEATTAPTARIRVSASYSEAVASLADELQFALGRSQVISPTVVIDTVTGMPVLVNNNFAGAQGGVSRVKRATISGVLTQEVDTFTVSFNRDERTTLSADAPGAPPAITWLSTTLGWQRELGSGVRGNTQITYGERSSAGFGRQELITFTAGVNWALSETLSTRASYTYSRSSSNRAGLGYDANLLALGLRKTF